MAMAGDGSCQPPHDDEDSLTTALTAQSTANLDKQLQALAPRLPTAPLLGSTADVVRRRGEEHTID